MKSLRQSIIIALAVLGSAVSAQDWPQWQGEGRDGGSKEKGLLPEWPKEGPPLVWKVKALGGGDSSPAIAKGRIYAMANRGGDEIVFALSEKDGSEIWVTRLGPASRQSMPQSMEGPGCTPTVDGDHLYVLGMAGNLACLQVADGKLVWQQSLVGDFGGRVPTWSYRESPLIDGDKLICTPGAPDAMLVALDKLTGKTIWKSALPAASAPADNAPAPGGDRGGGRGGRGGGGGDSAAGYASAIAIDFEGQRQYVQFAARALIGVSAADGKFLWRYDRPTNRQGISCTTPLYRDGLVFATSAYGAGGGAVKLSKDGNGGIKAEEAWFSRNMENHHGGVVVVDDALYGANGGNGGGYLACLDFKTGELLWSERDADKRRVKKGSMILADGRIYYRTEDGPIILIEPNRKEYLERGRFDQPDRTGKPAWAHPVIANGKLYIRDQDTLLCYDIKAK